MNNYFNNGGQMKYNYISKIIIMLIFIINIIYAGCGSCKGDIPSTKKLIQNKSIVNTLIMSIPANGIIDGLVITSCGKCNLSTDDRGCSLSVKIGDKIYPVKGTSIHDHGDAHGSAGFCRAVRVAWAKGKMIKDIFHADSFVLVGD